MLPFGRRNPRLDDESGQDETDAEDDKPTFVWVQDVVHEPLRRESRIAVMLYRTIALCAVLVKKSAEKQPMGTLLLRAPLGIVPTRHSYPA